MILAIKTNTHIAEISLFQGDKKMGAENWEAGRSMAEGLLDHIEKLLQKHDADWQDLSGVIVFKGPGSFTGLRIGATVANTIAYAQEVPIVGTQGDDWLQEGLERLVNKENDTQIIPEYGALPNITQPRTK